MESTLVTEYHLVEFLGRADDLHVQQSKRIYIE